MKEIHDLLLEHDFFRQIPQENIEFVAGCGQNTHFKAGEFIAHEGDDADYFYLLRSGLASIESHVPNKGTQVLQTVRAGDIAGWSWIYPPYKWNFDLKVIEPVSAIALDGKCLRAKCEKDTNLGYLFMKEFARIMTSRLKAARIQSLDVYGNGSNA